MLVIYFALSSFYFSVLYIHVEFAVTNFRDMVDMLSVNFSFFFLHHVSTFLSMVLSSSSMLEIQKNNHVYSS